MLARSRPGLSIRSFLYPAINNSLRQKASPTEAYGVNERRKEQLLRAISTKCWEVKSSRAARVDPLAQNMLWSALVGQAVGFCPGNSRTAKLAAIGELTTLMN